MTKTDKINQITISFTDYLVERLKDPAEAEAYINAVIEDGDPILLLTALRDVADAHGMTTTASKAAVERESLYRMLSRKGNPRFSSLVQILDALGLRLMVSKKKKAKQG